MACVRRLRDYQSQLGKDQDACSCSVLALLPAVLLGRVFEQYECFHAVCAARQGRVGGEDKWRSEGAVCVFPSRRMFGGFDTFGGCMRCKCCESLFILCHSIMDFVRTYLAAMVWIHMKLPE